MKLNKYFIKIVITITVTTFICLLLLSPVFRGWTGKKIYEYQALIAGILTLFAIPAAFFVAKYQDKRNHHAAMIEQLFLKFQKFRKRFEENKTTNKSTKSLIYYETQRQFVELLYDSYNLAVLIGDQTIADNIYGFIGNFQNGDGVLDTDEIAKDIINLYSKELGVRYKDIKAMWMSCGYEQEEVDLLNSIQKK